MQLIVVSRSKIWSQNYKKWYHLHNSKDLACTALKWNSGPNIASFETPKIMSRISPSKKLTFAAWTLLLRCALTTLKDLESNPKVCNLTIRISYFTKWNVFDRSVRTVAHTLFLSRAIIISLPKVLLIFRKKMIKVSIHESYESF